MSADWRPEGQRIPPLEPDQWDERARSVLAPTRERVAALQGDDDAAPRPLHILTTLAHHSVLLEAFVAFAATLTLRGRLPPVAVAAVVAHPRAIPFAIGNVFEDRRDGCLLGVFRDP